MYCIKYYYYYYSLVSKRRHCKRLTCQHALLFPLCNIHNIYLWYCQHKINRLYLLYGLHYWLCFCIYVCSLPISIQFNDKWPENVLQATQFMLLPPPLHIQHKYYWMSKYLLVYFFSALFATIMLLMSTWEFNLFESSMNFIHK